MSVANTFMKFKDSLFKAYAGDGGKMLVHMGALGWVFSSAAQLGAILTDKKIDKKKKKFLLPQEASDAAVNVVMYYSLCDLIKRGSDMAVERGYIIPGDIVDRILSLKPSKLAAVSRSNWRSLFSKEELKSLSKTFSNYTKMSMFENANGLDKRNIRNVMALVQEDFKSFKNGMGVFAAIFASVLACNLVTPYVRNKLANVVQKELNKKEERAVRKEQIVQNITTQLPLPNSMRVFNNYNKYSNIKI